MYLDLRVGRWLEFEFILLKIAVFSQQNTVIFHKKFIKNTEFLFLFRHAFLLPSHEPRQFHKGSIC